MKVRMKFTKTGPIRYVGHLDFMRYFSRAVARSGLPGAYSGGFSPHLLISFAAPLGVGEETLGDYADLELAFKDPYCKDAEELLRLEGLGLINEELPDAPTGDEMCAEMNRVLTEGVRILSCSRVGQTKKDKAMALVRSASYELYFKETFLPDLEGVALSAAVSGFFNQPEIICHKKTKKSEKDENIRPLMYAMSVDHKGEMPPERFKERREFSRCRKVSLTCATGSTQNLKPAMVMEAFCRHMDRPFDPYGFQIVRTDTFAEDGTALSGLGIQL